MYKCEECGELFEDYETYEEHHPYGMGYAVEEWHVCPHCGESGFKEVEECTRCGNFATYLTNGLCDCCHDEMYE